MPPDNAEVISLSSDSEHDNSNEHEQHALDDASRVQLRAVIATAPEGRIRDAFDALVTGAPEIPERVFRMLLATKQLPATGQAQAGDVPVPPTTLTVSRWRVCKNCHEEYDDGVDAAEDVCSYHPGNLEADEDAFEDWDERCHGPIDTEENIAKWPENFNWDCCDADGRSPGCKEGQHEPEPEVVQKSKKRRRYD